MNWFGSDDGPLDRQVAVLSYVLNQNV